jgi:hypothetical protein
MSRGFLSALGGIAMTIFSWYGPWEWPAWPAFAVIRLVFGTGGWYHDLGFAARGVVVVILIAINVATWAALFYLLARVMRNFSSRTAPSLRRMAR